MTLEIQTFSADNFSPLTLDEAVELTEQIRISVADLELSIVEAYYGQAWKVMDYESWDDYVQGEFKQAPLALPREDRRTQVASLRQQGLSLRAIGAVAGVDDKTVRNDLRTAENSAVVPDRIVGLDGKERPANLADTPKPNPPAPPEDPKGRAPHRLGRRKATLLSALNVLAGSVGAIADFDTSKLSAEDRGQAEKQLTECIRNLSQVRKHVKGDGGAA